MQDEAARDGINCADQGLGTGMLSAKGGQVERRMDTTKSEEGIGGQRDLEPGRSRT